MSSVRMAAWCPAAILLGLTVGGSTVRADADRIAEIIGSLDRVETALANTSYTAEIEYREPGKPVTTSTEEVVSVGTQYLGRTARQVAGQPDTRKTAFARGKGSATLWQNDAKYAEQVVSADGALGDAPIKGLKTLGQARPLTEVALEVSSRLTAGAFLRRQLEKNARIDVTREGERDVIVVPWPVEKGGSVRCKMQLERRGGSAILRAFEERWSDGRLNTSFEYEGEMAMGDGIYIPQRIVQKYVGPGKTPRAEDGWERLTVFKQARLLDAQAASRQVFDETALGMPAGTQLVRTSTDGTRTLLNVSASRELAPVEVLGPDALQTVAHVATPQESTSGIPVLLRVAALALATIGIAAAYIQSRRRRMPKTGTAAHPPGIGS